MGAQSSAACCASVRKPNGSVRKPSCLGTFGADIAQRVIGPSDGERSSSPARRSTLLLPSPSNRTKKHTLRMLDLAEESNRVARASSRDDTLSRLRAHRSRSSSIRTSPETDSDDDDQTIKDASPPLNRTQKNTLRTVELADESRRVPRSSNRFDTLSRPCAHQPLFSSRQITLEADSDDDDQKTEDAGAASVPGRLHRGGSPKKKADGDDQKIEDAGAASLLGRLDLGSSPKEKANDDDQKIEDAGAAPLLGRLDLRSSVKEKVKGKPQWRPKYHPRRASQVR